MTEISQPFAFAPSHEPSHAPARRARRPLRRAAERVLPGAGILALTLFMGALYVQPPLPSLQAFFARAPGLAPDAAPEPARVALAEPQAQPAEDPASAYGALVDARQFKLSALPETPAVVASLQARLEPAAPAEETELVDPPFPPPAPLRLGQDAALAPDEDAPLPAPRPRDFAETPKPEAAPPVGRARRLARQEPRPALAPGAPVNSGSIFDKIFAGLKNFGQQTQQRGQALAYAAPDGGVMNDAARLSPRIPSAVTPGVDRQTAVYDISARTVYMPDGTRLEAHSGLGDKMDDPRHVHVPMRGPTPPDVYELSLREQLFHGVQALRLTPIGGGRQYGRNGFLAHTYMLGPNGDSNGCVSFRNYGAFLRAFQNGQIKRLIVVARL